MHPGGKRIAAGHEVFFLRDHVWEKQPVDLSSKVNGDAPEALSWGNSLLVATYTSAATNEDRQGNVVIYSLVSDVLHVVRTIDLPASNFLPSLKVTVSVAKNDGILAWGIHAPAKDKAGEVIVYGRADWSNVLFPLTGHQPAALAQHYTNPALADGNMLPHQAFMLGFERMLETPRALFNALPAAHRQLYYRDLLRLKERAAEPDRVMLSFTLDDATPELLLPAGLLADAGQDDAGTPCQYRLEHDLLANRARLSDLRWCQPDATVGQTSRIVFDEQQELAWPVAGLRLFEDTLTPQAAANGSALAATALAMSGGVRVVNVTFATAFTAASLSGEISSANGWLPLTATAGSDKKSCAFTFAADAAASAPSQGSDGFGDAAPVIRIVSNDASVVPDITNVNAKAENAPALFATDDGAGDISERQYPLGAEPVLGSGCFFISADWLGKPDLTITVTPEWMDLPTVSFKTWYTGYTGTAASPTSPIADNNEFKVQASLVKGGAKVALGDAQPLFTASATAAPVGAALTFTLCTEIVTGLLADSIDPRDGGVWLEFTLVNKDFQHKLYWQALAEGKTVNPPYTPQWKSIKVDYTSIDTAVARQYQLSPFGHQLAAEADVPALDRAQLYLGFADLRPGQDLQLHWQLQSPQALVVEWQYLDTANRWVPLNAYVNDATDGLFQSGLWSAVLPQDASDQARAMPSGRCWIRGLIDVPAPETLRSAGYTGSPYPWLSGIHTNCAMAVLDQAADIAASHFARPLPALTIAQPVQAIDGLAAIVQPWPSTDGRATEPEADFTTRVAAQLSHRGRAVSWRDVRLLLRERFPEIYDVRLPEDDQRVDGAGVQTLTLIPAHGRMDNADSLRPEFSPAHLERMSDYLRSIASPWFRVQLCNPQYRTVEVAYSVTFNAGVNPDYAGRQLQQTVEQHYMPWARDGADTDVVAVGYRLDYYDVVALIQQQAYVAQVETLTLDGRQESVVSLPTEVLILNIAPTVLSTPSVAPFAKEAP